MRNYTDTNYINFNDWDDVAPEYAKTLFIARQDEDFVYGFFWRHIDRRKFGCKMKISTLLDDYVISPVQ